MACQIKSTETSLKISWSSKKIAEIKEHKGWQGTIDQATSENLLKEQAPFTYLLRSGKDMYHYFISYVDSDHSIQHKSILIDFSIRGWFYQNGGANIRENLPDLILVALHCNANECIAYGDKTFCALL